MNTRIPCLTMNTEIWQELPDYEHRNMARKGQIKNTYGIKGYKNVCA